MNKERLILGGVLGAAALGLAVDRLLLGGGLSGPQTALADTALAKAEPPKPSPTAQKTPRVNEASETLTDRFQRFATESGLGIDDIGDAMSDDGRLVRLQQDSQLVQTDSVERFKRDYELGLVMGSAGGPYTAYLKVVADPSRTIRVREGGSVDGFTLERIEVDPATGGAVAHFKRQGRTVQLSRSNGP